MKSAPNLLLSPKQKRLVRESFESVQAYGTSVVVLFYGRLFELAPEARDLFKIDIREQAKKLVDTLRTTIEALDHFEALLPVLAEMGRKHAGYGVQAYQYEKLRSALLWALGQALGLQFDPETRAAWDQLLSVISAVMLDGAAQAQPRRQSGA